MEECIFCKIVKGEIPSEKVYENDSVYAFKDISPEAPVHVLIIPKKHIKSINEITREDSEILLEVFLAASKIAEMNGIKEDGYRLVSNCGDRAGQTVKHLHFHFLGGRDLKWPPG
ncbi:histidine triad nucleotide-binding protein [Clostridium oryzae]|uniref:HIT-like protein n=1 Tax=Clostridium oryzae TaxID=1450648 RepID=A0A1V4IUY7_9CLOT|nr:histidine triad nucleotide-binding protein [Clostridium oryzae]OPJ63851.1 HIT-like protein [Clostridium oryzae]